MRWRTVRWATRPRTHSSFRTNPPRLAEEDAVEYPDSEELPLDEPPAEEGDDSVHRPTGGALDHAALEGAAETAAADELLVEAEEALLEEELALAEDPERAEHFLEAMERVMARHGRRKLTVRERAVRAAMLGYIHRAQIHYTQGPRRWDGINRRPRAGTGATPSTRIAHRL